MLTFVIFISCEIFYGVNGQNIFAQTATAGNIKGKIQTANGKNFGVYLGIPFAKPPIGDLRFKHPNHFNIFSAPQPLNPTSTSTMIDASNNFSKMCVQALDYTPMDQSEDCLYLNVLTPKTQSSDTIKYPVMVWVHGGGFLQGSASEYPVGGTLRNIVSRGIVFVSLNYRLGAFGFLTTRSSVAAGNYGMLDQVEALRWVNKNIQYFGGDSAKVTIFGESAGGASVSLLSVSSLTKGLFSQAIIMSGSALAPWALMHDGDPMDFSGNIFVSLGCRQKVPVNKSNVRCPYKSIHAPAVTSEVLNQHETELKCLRSKSVAEIASQPSAIALKPRIDNNFLPESPDVLIKNRSPYNLMIGVDAGESAFFEFIKFPGFNGLLAQTESEFNRSSVLIDCITFKYPDLVNFTVHYHYAHSSTPTASNLDDKHFWFQQTLKMKTSTMFWVPAYQEAIEAKNSKSTVYLYSWDYQNAMDFYDPKTDFYWKGAPHASELFPLFDTNNTGYFVRDGNHTRRDKSQDSKSTEVFGKLFTNFAKFGNPTPDDSIDSVIWKPFTVENAEYLSIDMPKIKMANKFYEDDARLWSKFLPALEESVTCEGLL